MDDFLEQLESVYCCHSSACTYIVGDFSAKHSDWFKDQVIDSCGEALKCFADSHHLQQIVAEPTFNVASESLRPSLLDLIFTNNPATLLSHNVLPPIADHCPVHIHLTLKKSLLPRSFVHKHYLYSDARLDDLIANLQSADWHATGNISDTVASWTQHFVDVCNAHIPRRTTRIDPSSKPWYSRHLRYLASCRDRLFHRVKKGGLHSQLMVAYWKVRNLLCC